MSDIGIAPITHSMYVHNVKEKLQDSFYNLSHLICSVKKIATNCTGLKPNSAKCLSCNRGTLPPNLELPAMLCIIFLKSGYAPGGYDLFIVFYLFNNYITYMYPEQTYIVRDQKLTP